MRTRTSAIGILVGGLIALAASLTIHALMLEGLHVPSPHLPHVWWTRLPDRIMQTAGLIGLFALLSPELKASLGRPALVLLIVFLTVTETLFRDPFMEVVNLSNLTLYPFLDVVPLYLTAAFLVAGVVAARRFVVSLPGAVAVCLVLACVVYLIVRPLLDVAFVPVQAWTAAREGHGLYEPPYDWHILVPAYATFAEPVVGSFLVCALASSRLPPAPTRAWAILALIVFALRGVLFACVTYIPLAPFDAGTAMMSEGQFALENASLAMIVAATWVLAVKRPTARTRPASV